MRTKTKKNGKVKRESVTHGTHVRFPNPELEDWLKKHVEKRGIDSVPALLRHLAQEYRQRIEQESVA